METTISACWMLALHERQPSGLAPSYESDGMRRPSSPSRTQPSFEVAVDDVARVCGGKCHAVWQLGER
jgi:hypothetical protein